MLIKAISFNIRMHPMQLYQQLSIHSLCSYVWVWVHVYTSILTTEFQCTQCWMNVAFPFDFPILSLVPSFISHFKNEYFVELIFIHIHTYLNTCCTLDHLKQYGRICNFFEFNNNLDFLKLTIPSRLLSLESAPGLIDSWNNQWFFALTSGSSLSNYNLMNWHQGFVRRKL